MLGRHEFTTYTMSFSKMTFANLFLRFPRSLMLQMYVLSMSFRVRLFWERIACVLVKLVPQCILTESKTNFTRAMSEHLI